MLEWLKSKLTSAPPWQNQAGLPAPLVQLLAKDFGQLDERWPGLAGRVMIYVLDGGSDEVLTELMGLPVGPVLALTIARHDYREPIVSDRTRFFQQVTTRDAAFFLRLARVYDAASRLPHQFPTRLFAEDRRWVEAFLWEASNLAKGPRAATAPPCPAIDAALLEEMLELAGQPASALVEAVFKPYTAQVWVGRPLLLWLPGFRESIVRHRALVDDALAAPEFYDRSSALSELHEVGIPLEPFSETIVALAVGTAKMVREEALSMLHKEPSLFWPALERKAAQGTPAERSLAAQLLWKMAGEKSRPFLEQRLAQERTNSVLAVLRDLLPQAGSMVQPAVSASVVALPPVPPVDPLAPLGEETRAAWLKEFGALNQALANTQTRVAGQMVKPLSAAEIDRFFALLQKPLPDERLTLPPEFYLLAWQEPGPKFAAFFRRPELSIIHVLRFSQVVRPIINMGDEEAPTLDWWLTCNLEAFRSVRPGFGLREVAAGCVAAGVDSSLVPRALINEGTVNAWAPEDVWPYWAEHPEILREYLEPTGKGYLTSDWRCQALRILSYFPQPPAEFVTALWEAALGNLKAERPVAQQCLAGVADRQARILAALASGKAERRAVAADWLRRLRDPASAEPLLTALHKEKNEVTKGAIMLALEQLGVPLEQFLDRASLLPEARAGLANGEPPALAAFPWNLPPTIHWADNGALIEPEIGRWWIAQQVKLRTPEPGPLLRRYAESWRAGEREALGLFLLQTWTASDKGLNMELKGLLAVAAACGGAELAPIVQAYLKEWYGLRAAQCQALLQMLGWVEHPSATQVLLATGARFRTRSIQQTANQQVQALAERKGWTREELSDRTIPTAGFDEHGVLTLDFGPRQFTARLNAAQEITLFDPEGQPLKTLPEPRREDDAELAAAAKKSLAAAKKELKTVLTMQRDRLYEAMCVERRWRFEEWQLYLNQHPIVRHYTQRLVWAVWRENQPAAFVRPLPDGTLTNTDDATVILGPGDLLGLAHELQATPEVAQAWLAHLQDYAIEPLFEQFGKPTFTPNAAQLSERELAMFEGHLIEAFKLRGRATKLGYTRGQTQDGGIFYDYVKRFPALQMEVTLHFSGNRLPENNDIVALKTLRFDRARTGEQSAAPGSHLTLRELPPVLVSECWNDLRQIAAEGTGYDPEWRQKCGC